MRVWVTAAASVAVLSMAGAASAQAVDGRWALGAQLGTTGVGVEAQFRATDTIVLRGALEGFRIDRDFETGGVDYEGSARWFTDSALLDLHPFSNPFTVTAGAYYGKRKVTLRGTPSEPVRINGALYSPAQIGELRGRAKFSSFAPFVGIGWDTTFHSASRWGFKARAGAILGKTPDVQLTASGPIAALPDVNTYLLQEELAAREELDKFKTWPVVQVGLSYRF